MNIPIILPPEKRSLLENLADDLSRIPLIRAVILGGSFASGTQHNASDLDIGLYYLEADPFSMPVVKEIAERIARPGTRPTVTGFYEWGAWVNGGAWIETEAGKLDFLYRNLDQVQRTILEAQAGISRHDYDQQPAHGFYNVGYLAETQICIPLYDPKAASQSSKSRWNSIPTGSSRTSSGTLCGRRNLP